MIITNQQLEAIIHPIKYTGEHVTSIVTALNTTFQRYEINTKLRVCHFLAQVLHESGAFKYSVELWGNTSAQKGYDTRADLGNSPELDNDGYFYRGRAWLQLTGKANYKAASVEFKQDFVNHPELVGQEPWDSLVSGWFFKRKGLNELADQDNVNTITKRVNGAYNGLSSRVMWLSKAKDIIK